MCLPDNEEPKYKFANHLLTAVTLPHRDLPTRGNCYNANPNPNQINSVVVRLCLALLFPLKLTI